ncbi:MAG: peptidoglycan bridge formation glycyltransferase FemA/FemB family protein [Chloroflexi bacterium]|nr:peptidoglycan bridge formation glycyltransferase FemA/FemB family protein [Chloroflexota bacterium]
MTTFRPADPGELLAWDDLTVHLGGGNIFQSRAWAEHRRRTGWRPAFVVGDDGSAVLALERPWPLLRSGSWYLPRGPIPAGAVPAMAARLGGITDHLAGRGADVVATDAEIPAGIGYESALVELGFSSIEEIQPSRHRMRLPLGHAADESGVFGGIAKATRQRIARAERDGVTVVRHDRRALDVDPGAGFVGPAEPLEVALGRFFDLLVETGERRQFVLGPRAAFLEWWKAAHEAGLIVHLEARDRAGTPLAGLLLYRHGGRLSTAYSADHAASRRDHPGMFHLLRWRAIQLAIREGCAEMDLGGADVRGVRHEPRPGDPMYGLYEHKRSFGAEWVEQVGAHERILHPRRYAAGRVLLGIGRRVTQ